MPRYRMIKKISISSIILIILLLGGCRSVSSDSNMNKESSNSPKTPDNIPFGLPTNNHNDPDLTENGSDNTNQGSSEDDNQDDQIIIDRNLIIEVSNWIDGVNNIVWISSPPYEAIKQLTIQGEENFCCLSWSPNGDMLFGVLRINTGRKYANILLDQIINNETEIELITLGNHPVVNVIGWARDGSGVYLNTNNDEVLFLNIQDGSINPCLVPQELKDLGINYLTKYFRHYDIANARLLSSGDSDLLLTSLCSVDTFQLIDMPEDFSVIGYDAFHWGTGMSSDGRYILVPDYVLESNLERIWRYDLERGIWEIVVSSRLQPLPDFFAWSEDDEYIGGWDLYIVGDGSVRISIYFLDSENYEIIRTYKKIYTGGRPGPSIVGWTHSVNGEAVFGIFLPDEGVWMLDPNNSDRDFILIDANIIKEQVLPNWPPDLLSLSWQP